MDISDFQIRLRNGAGNGNPADGLCLMQAVDWFSGADKISDRPECASPALCAIGIRLNDMAPSQEHRNRLWPLVWQLLDSRDLTTEQARAEHIVREVTHRIVAPIFDQKYPELAADLRAARTMDQIELAAWAAAAAAQPAAEEDEAWATEAWTAAEAVEAAAAWAAGSAAEVSVAAEVAEAAEAAMAAGRAAGRAARAPTAAAWEELRLIFIEAINLGKHGSADPVYVPRALELRRALKQSNA